MALSSKSSLLGIVVLIVLLFGVGVLSFSIFFNPKNDVQPIVETKVTPIEEVNVSLKEQIASIPKSLAQTLQATRIYLMLSEKNEAITKSFVFEDGVFKEGDSSVTDGLFYSYSQDGEKMVFLGIPNNTQQDQVDWTTRAHLYSYAKSELEGPFPDILNATLVSATDLPLKQVPVISNTGKVLFMAGGYPPHTDLPPAVEGMTIYHVVDGVSTFLTNGYMPKWISDTEFIFFKNDGIYKASEDLSTMELLIPPPVEASVLVSNRMDISQNGNVIVWSQPNARRVTIFEKNTEGKFIEMQTIDAKAFWVAISPDNHYLAMQTVNLTASGEEDDPGAKIEFYDLQAFLKVPELEISLQDFNQLGMFMTDWVNK